MLIPHGLHLPMGKGSNPGKKPLLEGKKSLMLNPQSSCVLEPPFYLPKKINIK